MGKVRILLTGGIRLLTPPCCPIATRDQRRGGVESRNAPCSDAFGRKQDADSIDTGSRIPRPCRQGQVSDVRHDPRHLPRFPDGPRRSMARSMRPLQHRHERPPRSGHPSDAAPQPRREGSSRLTIIFLQPQGREAGEEEGPQGPREEETHIHPSLRERPAHRRQAQGKPTIIPSAPPYGAQEIGCFNLG